MLDELPFLSLRKVNFQPFRFLRQAWLMNRDGLCRRSKQNHEVRHRLRFLLDSK